MKKDGYQKDGQRSRQGLSRKVTSCDRRARARTASRAQGSQPTGVFSNQLPTGRQAGGSHSNISGSGSVKGGRMVHKVEAYGSHKEERRHPNSNGKEAMWRLKKGET